jgi:hypothetical protein
VKLHTAATLPIPQASLTTEIARNRFTLYDHQHDGGSLFILDDDSMELLGYIQWTQWQSHVEITAVESARPGCGRALVAWLKHHFDRLVTTSRLNAGTLRFWRRMGFVQDRDDMFALFWVRR